MAFTGSAGNWEGPDLPEDNDDPVFHALIGALFDRLLLLESMTALGANATAAERTMAKAFADEWWSVLAGGDLDGVAWLERIGQVVEPAALRDPSRVVLETALDVLRGTSSREGWRQAVSELRELLERPTMERWNVARFPTPDHDVGRWDGPVFHPPPRLVEYEALRSELPLCVEFGAAIDRDVVLASVGDLEALRAHGATSGELLRELALLGVNVDFPGPDADTAEVTAVARSLRV